jgi:hypothetical protein
MAHRYVPALADSARTKLLYSWKKAVSKALNWDDDSVTAQALERQRSRSSMSSSSIIDSSSSSRAQGDTTTAAAAAAAANSSSASCAVKRKLRGQRSAKGDAPCGDVCVTWREAGALTAAVAAVFSAGLAVGLLALKLGSSSSSSSGSGRLRR